MTRIVKRRGSQRYETFSRDKLKASIIAACNSVYTAEGGAETAAEAVCAAIDEWKNTRPEITSDDIRRVAARTLKIHNPDAAYYYSQHKHII